MNIQLIKRKKGHVYKATIGSSKHRRTRNFLRKLDAQTWLARQLSSFNEKSNEREVQPVSFQELFRLFQTGYAEIQQQPGTRQREEEITKKHLLPYFGVRDVTKFKSKDIQQYLHFELRLGKRKPSTINKHFQVIHKVFAWAIKNGFMAFNPAVGVTKLPTKDTVYSPDYRFLEGKDLENALIKAREIYPKEFPVIFTAVSTGLRLGEVCALLRRDLFDSITNPVLAVRRTYCGKSKQFKNSTKGGKARIVPIGNQLLAGLKTLVVDKRDSDFIFFENEKEAAATWNNIRVKWKRVQKKCGIEPRSFHDLRHTYATQFLSHGGSSFALQRILGHSSAKITDKYSHFSQALLESSRNIVQYPGLPSQTL